MKILLLGKHGQVGWELQRSLSLLGEVTALGREPENGWCGDLCQPDRLVRTIRALEPRVICNAAAYTAVDRAETERELAQRVNGEAPGLLAAEAVRLDALLVHYSTDSVFSGQGERPWREDDVPAPINHYGRTKLAGEAAIRAAGCRHLIFRTSWVFAVRGHNFLRTLLDLARSDRAVRMVDDQLGSPTPADLVADVTAHALVREGEGGLPPGTYHVASRDGTSKLDYARFAFAHLADTGVIPAHRVDAIAAAASTEFPSPASRPRNARLAVDRIEQALSVRLPSWRESVRRVLDELTGAADGKAQ